MAVRRVDRKAGRTAEMKVAWSAENSAVKRAVCLAARSVAH